MTKNIFSSLNLAYNPFSLATSRQGFYQTESTRLILDEFVHGIETRKGFMVLLGEVGVGKTSLSLQLFAALEEKQVAFAWVFNTVFTKEELFRAIADDFGLESNPAFSLLDYQKQLHAFFLQKYEKDEICVIVVDEAHNLSDESMESLRMLTNFETDGQKLVQVVLIGQPELGMKLDQEHMRQLRSRVTIYETLPQLNREELAGYVNFKLAEAGSQIRLEGRPLKRLWDFSRGNLRQAKLVMERVLYGCVAFRSNGITSKIMGAAIAEVLAISAPPVRRQISPFFGGLFSGFALTLTVIAALVVIPFWKGNGHELNVLDLIGARMMTPKIAQPPHEPEKKQKVDAAHPDVPLLKEAKILESYLGMSMQKSLEDAVRLHFPALLGRDLPKGVVMLQMETLPAEPDTAQEWTAFFWRKFVPIGPTWVVFWRPVLHLEDIAPGESRPDVVPLQELLAKQEDFKGPLNGVFGSDVSYALAEFQRRAGLIPTGRPNALTLFQLRFGISEHSEK